MKCAVELWCAVAEAIHLPRLRHGDYGWSCDVMDIMRVSIQIFRYKFQYANIDLKRQFLLT